MIDLPYFDLLLEGRHRGDAASKIFDRYVHWGYWDRPGHATRDLAEFVAAMDRLNSEVIAVADLQDRQSVLDAGCGFGGTLAAIQARKRGMSLTGLNIDARQLEIAREQVPGVCFIEGDACSLPFEAESFDRVLAVECVFHFPSRVQFLKESARVLKPGGRIALSDFVPWRISPSINRIGTVIERQICKGYGELGKGWCEGDYHTMARNAGLRLIVDRDITAQTLPTYPILQNLFGALGQRMVWPTRWLKWISNLRLLRYRILGFVKEAPSKL